MNIYLIIFIVYFGIIIATSIAGSKKVESAAIRWGCFLVLVHLWPHGFL